MAELRISQPTLSRSLQALGAAVTSFRIRGNRAPLYGLLRPLPLGLPSRLRISRILSNGSIDRFADVEFLFGGATVERTDQTTWMYQGLPPYMAFSAPTGFLGRRVAHNAARAEPSFPENLRDWSDDHRIAFLFTRGLNLAGNLVFGEAPLQREIELRAWPPTPVSQRIQHYVSLASALREAAYGSSAGGEQPKFQTMVEDAGHVIVKFAKRGTRMAELLPMEHLALEALASVGIPASHTRVFASDDYVFLEVQRFDRIGPTGRVGMLSAGSVDDEFFGLRQSWTQFADRCVQERCISPNDAFHVNVMAAFSELIGNNDRHHENISLLVGDDGEYAGMAPAYDILPMRYATVGAGIDPHLSPIAPAVGAIGAQPAVWEAAACAAEAFWTAVQSAEPGAPISAPSRELAAINLSVARDFVAPLLPVNR